MNSKLKTRNLRTRRNRAPYRRNSTRTLLYSITRDNGRSNWMFIRDRDCMRRVEIEN